jgi:hypothetical protein
MKMEQLSIKFKVLEVVLEKVTNARSPEIRNKRLNSSHKTGEKLALELTALKFIQI